jgi:hypothetical protein
MSATRLKAKTEIMMSFLFILISSILIHQDTKTSRYRIPGAPTTRKALVSKIKTLPYTRMCFNWDYKQNRYDYR